MQVGILIILLQFRPLPRNPIGPFRAHGLFKWEIKKREAPEKFRTIYLLQRKSSKLGINLGKTTGWIHRSSLIEKGVKILGGVDYSHIDGHGIHFARKGKFSIFKNRNKSSLKKILKLCNPIKV